MKYVMHVLEDGKSIWKHDVPVKVREDFADSVRDAILAYHQEYPGKSLWDQDILIRFEAFG